jgi:hypothetical protein
MKLSKTNYLVYRDCAHNAWVKAHLPASAAQCHCPTQAITIPTVRWQKCMLLTAVCPGNRSDV